MGLGPLRAQQEKSTSKPTWKISHVSRRPPKTVRHCNGGRWKGSGEPWGPQLEVCLEDPVWPSQWVWEVCNVDVWCLLVVNWWYFRVLILAMFWQQEGMGVGPNFSRWLSMNKFCALGCANDAIVVLNSSLVVCQWQQYFPIILGFGIYSYLLLEGNRIIQKKIVRCWPFRQQATRSSLKVDRSSLKHVLSS